MNKKKDKKAKKFKHLFHEERLNLQGYLDAGKNIVYIAKALGRSRNCIYYEIRAHLKIKEGSLHSLCVSFYEGKRFFCNGCPYLNGCKRNKALYSFIEADKEAHRTRHSGNKGIHCSDEEFARIDEVFYDGVQRGLSLEVIYILHKGEFNVSLSTIRRWIAQGRLRVKLIYLRRAKTYKKEYKYRREKDENVRKLEIRIGRQIIDFQKRIREHPDDIVLQLDSVIGKQNDLQKCLTIMFPKLSFQIGILYPSGKDCNLKVMDAIDQVIEILFKDKPNICLSALADNGPEFDSVYLLEEKYKERFHLYFARPYCSTDKSQCERNHELLRYILPKGASFNLYKQDDFDRFFSNINSYPKKSLNWKSSCRVFAEAFSESTMNDLGIHKIPDHELNLRCKA